ncbi:MAG: hypothetical protein BAJALOKI2v1_10003 [Promethearchaeota archaeon]|nr:MAG: hypothetical protein BAJALOKI2v1_10003 [Candidatus Lokiarchaeota archaeon]
MLLWENKKKKFLNTLKLGINPFRRFVATGEIKESLGVVPSREEFIEKISENVCSNDNFIQPIIGDVGIGKTHLFWALKRKLSNKMNSIYLSLEQIYRKFYFNLYSEIIDEIGIEELRTITRKLCERWGANEKKFGFFRIADIDNVRNNAWSELKDQFNQHRALRDVINIITAHQLDPYKRTEAEKVLLGELLNVRELSLLGVHNDLRKKRNAYIMLRIIIQNSELGNILFIDDFEKIIGILNSDEETEEVFDSSWLYGSEQTPESIEAQKLIDRILELHKIEGLRILITLRSLDALEEIKETISRKNEKLLLTFKEPFFLVGFQKEDIFYFYKKHMKQFFERINISDYDELLDSVYPLNKEILNKIHEKTNGNPREVIKAFIKIFNELAYYEGDPEGLGKEDFSF